MKLPKELQILILEYTDPLNRDFDIEVYNHKFYPNPPLPRRKYHVDDGLPCDHHDQTISCVNRPDNTLPSIFLVSKDIRTDALSILFATHRIILTDGHCEILAWLRAQPVDLLSRIRMLDLLFDENDVYKANDTPTSSFAWKDLVNFIATHLNLHRLFLSIDLSWHQGRNISTEAEADNAVRSYRTIAVPLYQLRGLHRFHVFLPSHFDMEAIVEQVVMGLKYESTLDGKTPAALRDWSDPHDEAENDGL